jgi:hypothetical protein
MKEVRDNTSRKGGLYLRCPVSASVHFSLRDEGSSGYMCVKGERVGENVYRVPGVCPLGSNDFEF